jgi:hypothetical protein
LVEIEEAISADFGDSRQGFNDSIKLLNSLVVPVFPLINGRRI